jgi:NADH-quinone oxidoreductase subunit I
VKFNQIVKTIFFTEIIKGMALTMKTLFTKPVTRQYPKEKRPVEPGFRGLHALVRDPSTGREKCIACGLCAAICPSQCITMHTGEDADNQKVIESYEVEVLRCLFCALCVEACPVGAIVLTEHYEYAGCTREEFRMTKEKLLDNWDKYMADDKGSEYFKKFWHPVSNDLKSNNGQAVFERR